MKRFLYVQAIVDRRMVESNPGGIRFRHTVIEAKSVNEAYAAGGRWSDANPPHPEEALPEGMVSVFATPPRLGYRPDIETINDYVVEIDPQAQPGERFVKPPECL